MDIVSSAPTSAREVLVHLMRHEESQHKLKYAREQLYSITDPDLTEEGRLSCHEFSQNFSSFNKYISHIWCSPMKRTINTALLSFKDATDRGVKVQAMDVLQNWDSSPNGIGMDKEDLRKYFGEQVDFDKVEEGWNKKSSGRWAPDNQEWKIPALKQALKDLQSSINRVEVVIVSHGSTLNKLSGRKKSWHRNKVRSYLVNDLGELYQRQDEKALEQLRLHAAGKYTIPALDQKLSNNLEESEPAAILSLENSKHSGKTFAVNINYLNKAITEEIQMSIKGELLENLKQTGTSPDVLVRGFQENPPTFQVGGAAIEEVKASVTSTLTIILRTCGGHIIPLTICWRGDSPIIRILVMTEQMRGKVSIERLMGEKDQALDDDSTTGRELGVAV